MMDKEQVFKLARKAGFFPDYNWNKTDWHSAGHSDLFESFATLVAAHEREACAKFCETNQVWVGGGKRGFTEWGHDDFVTGGRHQGMDYAEAIRARGND